jgi:ABC-type transport system substrate-binding protein
MELKQATFNNQSVWNSGFTLQIMYNEGGIRRISVEMIRAFFQTLSTYDGRSGPAFTVNIGTTDWANYLKYAEAKMLPLFDIGWLADFADADNLMCPYIRSSGARISASSSMYFAPIQNYTLTNGWGNTHGSNCPVLNKDELIEKAFTTPDGPDRAKMYADLEFIYLVDCPSFPIPTPTGRLWCQHWVKGWYYNAMYPSGSIQYIPSVYKYDDCWYDVSGQTPNIQDGIVNMRDITYLILHFNAKASISGSTPDPKWVDTYGNGGVDPYGDRVCNMRDIANAILHFNHKNNTLTP